MAETEQLIKLLSVICERFKYWSSMSRKPGAKHVLFLSPSRRTSAKPTMRELPKGCGSQPSSTTMGHQWFLLVSHAFPDNQLNFGSVGITLSLLISNWNLTMPLPEDLMQKLGGGLGFTQIDLVDAYNQIMLAPESQRRLLIEESYFSHDFFRHQFSSGILPRNHGPADQGTSKV